MSLEPGLQATFRYTVAEADTAAALGSGEVPVLATPRVLALAEHGAEYRLCQIYSNEPWHYELRPEAMNHGCPPMYADPTHDPRMQP